MKKYLLGLFAVVLAVGFSAFTVKKVSAPKQAAQFAVYTLTTQVGEINSANYTLQPTQPTLSCPGAAIVCWFRVTDLNGDLVINSADVAIRADQLDTDNDNFISDNQAEVAGQYQEKQ